LHPVLFRIPGIGFELRSYGLFIALAFLFATGTAAARARRSAIKPDTILDLAVYLIVGAIVGARLAFTIQNWGAFGNWWEAFFFWRGGLVFYGGVIVAALAAIVFARVKKIRILALLDVIAPSVALGLFLGRIGCFLNGCNFGTPTNLPWGVVFPEGSFVYTDSVLPSGAAATITYPTSVHPAQLYSALIALVLYVFLEWMFRKKKAYDGQIALLFGFLYPVSRFAVEFFRGDNPRTILGMTLSQAIGVIYFALTLFLYLYLRQKRAGKKT
jgi:phosphatidylglycerol:prolipoprotein diacylglycerol transferase